MVPLHYYCPHVTLMPMASHDQKSNFVPDFNFLDIKNAMVSLIMPQAAHVADTSANSTKGPKLVTSHFDHLDVRNLLMPSMMSSVL